MRKLFFGLAAAVLIAALATPTFAADLKYTGVFRMRGTSAENNDKNDKSHDSTQYADFLMRPRWTATSEGGKVWAAYELDFTTGNTTFGSTTGRPAVGTNRFLVDFAIPGTTFRARFGKSDWTSVDREFIDSVGRNRIQGYGMYGKMWGPLSMSVWTAKYEEGTTAASDGDLYYGQIQWKAAPAITVTPFLAYDHDNGVSGTTFGSATTDVNVIYYGLHGKAKFGIATVEAMGIYEDGDLDFSRGVNAGGIKDQSIDAWLARLKVWMSFGKLKVGFQGLWTTGDDDTTSATGRIGRQTDNKLKRFVAPRNEGTGWFDGPQIITGRRWSTISPMGSIRDREATGDGGARGNGLHIWEALAKYKLTKDLQVSGSVSIVRSAAKRADLDTNWDGTVDTKYKGAKDIGTEIDVGMRYNIYKSLWVQVAYCYLFTGDYGQVDTTPSPRDNDDAWATYFEIRHTF